MYTPSAFCPRAKVTESFALHPPARGGGGRDGGVLESFPVTEKHVLVLASNSPRRRQLLALADWLFYVNVADVDESQRPDEPPAGYVLRLAETKAPAVTATMHQINLTAATPL